MRDLFYQKGYVVLNEYKEVNLDRFFIDFTLNDNTVIGFYSFQNLYKDIIDILYLGVIFQSTTTV
jgi:hypothetical protein